MTPNACHVGNFDIANRTEPMSVLTSRVCRFEGFSTDTTFCKLSFSLHVCDPVVVGPKFLLTALTTNDHDEFTFYQNRAWLST